MSECEEKNQCLGLRIGSGTFGVVYELSQDPQRCAVKVYNKPINTSPHATMVREWAVLSAMRGRFGVLPSYSFSMRKQYRMAMPRGLALWPHTLRRVCFEQRLKRKDDEQNEKESLLKSVQNCAFDLFTQLLGSLYLAGVEHRDVKPCNVVAMSTSVCANNGARRQLSAPKDDEDCTNWSFHLIDYGAAKRASCYPTNFVTTHIYRAPEKLAFQNLISEPQNFPTLPSEMLMPRFKENGMACEPFMKMRWSERVDVWAMGILLYEFATGHHYIPAKIWEIDEDDMEKENTEKKILQYHIQSQNKWRKQISAIFPDCKMRDSFINLLSRCLTIEPENRASLHECWQHEFVQQAAENSTRRLLLAQKLVVCFFKRPQSSFIRFKTVTPTLERIETMKYLFTVGCDAKFRCQTVSG